MHIFWPDIQQPCFMPEAPEESERRGEDEVEKQDTASGTGRPKGGEGGGIETE